VAQSKGPFKVQGMQVVFAAMSHHIFDGLPQQKLSKGS
jgi:hypothetical protein